MENILCDIDQVVVDIEQPMIDIYNWLTGKRLTKDKWNTYYLRDLDSPEIEKKVFEVLWERDFTDMPLVPHAREGLAFLSDRYDIYFATTRPSRKANDTYEMIKINQFKCKDVIFNPDKAKIARKLNTKFALEDYWINAVEISKVCNVILFDYPYNRFNGISGITRIQGFDDESWWLNLIGDNRKWDGFRK